MEGDGFVAEYRTLACQQNQGVGAIAGFRRLDHRKSHNDTTKTPECWPPKSGHNTLEDPRKLLHPVHFLIRHVGRILSGGGFAVAIMQGM